MLRALPMPVSSFAYADLPPPFVVRNAKQNASGMNHAVFW
jgi:hypothetical protein